MTELGLCMNDPVELLHAALLTSSLKKSVFYNWLINNILYLCVPSFWGTQKIF